jgi:hypothetical protein
MTEQLSDATFVGGYTDRELHRLRKTASADDRAIIAAELNRRAALYGARHDHL